MKSETLHISVGALVTLVGIVVFGYSYLSDGRVDVEDGYSLHARFSAVDGINEGSDVLMAGIPIGHVTKQWFDNSSHNVMITMQIDHRYEIPYDSSALIVSDGIFGNKYVKVAPGGEFDMLENGDEFEYVQDSVIFEDLLEKVIVASENKRAAEKAKMDIKPVMESN